MDKHDDLSLRSALFIVATFGVAVMSGCGTAPAAPPPVVSTCTVAAPAVPASTPTPAAPPAVVRVVARPAYARAVIPPLPKDVYAPMAQRRTVAPSRVAESGKSKDDAKL